MSQYFRKLFRSSGENINIKVDLSNYATKSDLKNVTHVDTSYFALKTNLLVENELSKLKTFDSSYFIGKSHFGENGTENYLVFQPLNKYNKYCDYKY